MKLRIRPIFAWYDFWIGVFIQREKRRVYIFPLPCIGLVVSWGTADKTYDYRRVGWVHDATVRAMQWDGVPVHQHPEHKITDGHVAVYERGERDAT